MNLKLSLALTAALLPALALATSPVDVQIVGKSPAPSVVVRYGDLNLSTAEGARTLHQRLASAAWEVCVQMLPNPVSIEGGQCRQELIEAAMDDVNHQQALRHGEGSPVVR